MLLRREKIIYKELYEGGFMFLTDRPVCNKEKVTDGRALVLLNSLETKSRKAL